jgi:hypothetical protein
MLQTQKANRSQRQVVGAAAKKPTQSMFACFKLCRLKCNTQGVIL